MGHAVKRVGHFDLLHNYIRRVDPDPMTARKPGDKTMRFLGKRMRQGHASWYLSAKWNLFFYENHNGSFTCDLVCIGIGYRASSIEPTAEAAILECEAQALTLFKQLGELCNYDVEE